MKLLLLQNTIDQQCKNCSKDKISKKKANRQNVRPLAKQFVNKFKKKIEEHDIPARVGFVYQKFAKTAQG